MNYNKHFRTFFDICVGGKCKNHLKTSSFEELPLTTSHSAGNELVSGQDVGSLWWSLDARRWEAKEGDDKWFYFYFFTLLALIKKNKQYTYNFSFFVQSGNPVGQKSQPESGWNLWVLRWSIAPSLWRLLGGREGLREVPVGTGLPLPHASFSRGGRQLWPVVMFCCCDQDQKWGFPHVCWSQWFFWWTIWLILFPQQRKLMGSSYQISSGVCRCGSQEQVPERGSGRFRRVPVCADVGSRGRFRRVLESSGEFRRVPGSSGAGVGSGGRVRKVPESSGAATLTGAAMWLFWLAGDHIVHMGKATAQNKKWSMKSNMA